MVKYYIPILISSKILKFEKFSNPKSFKNTEYFLNKNEMRIRNIKKKIKNTLKTAKFLKISKLFFVHFDWKFLMIYRIKISENFIIVGQIS